MKTLLQWILSKLFPYNKYNYTIKELTSNSVWDKMKQEEIEEFYGGTDGTARR